MPRAFVSGASTAKDWLGVVAIAAVLVTPAIAAMQPPPGAQAPPQQTIDAELSTQGSGGSTETPDAGTQLDELWHAVLRLPVAAALACVLAMRPRRRGTPRRQQPVIQTQIILAVVGSMVMLVVGASLARAFGIVGAAGLVRYRAKIDDPKDAGVMLSTLAIGLACGVGLWILAAFATAFILGLLWVIESFEPKAHKLFSLTIKSKDSVALKPKIERVLARSRVEHELRTSANDEISYDVRVPLDKKTDRLSELILKLEPGNSLAVQWEEKKEKK